MKLVKLEDLPVKSLFIHDIFIYQIVERDYDNYFIVKEFAIHHDSWYPSTIERKTVFQGDIQVGMIGVL